MPSDAYAFVATNDLVGVTRGRSLPLSELNPDVGVGWVPADLAIDAFGTLATPNPFGSLGDLRLIPDVETAAPLPIADGELPVTLMIGDQVNIDGTAWSCCPRSTLKHSLARLEQGHGLRLFSAFEHEFLLFDADGSKTGGHAFGLDRFLMEGAFGTVFMRGLSEAGISVDTWLPEFGPGQFEVAIKPRFGVRAADDAVLVREIARSAARSVRRRASFVPLPHPDAVGNGVHVHLSLWRGESPVLYDASRQHGLSTLGESALAGVLRHAHAIQAWTAPSQISHLRLTPHRWSAAGAFIGQQTREALVRICPITSGMDPARTYNVEYRAVDATANPYLALAAIVQAMCEGLDESLTLDTILEAEPEDGSVPPLPANSGAALDAWEADPIAVRWFASELAMTQRAVRQSEEQALAGMDPAERCAHYTAVY